MNYYTFRVDDLVTVNTKETITDFLSKYERYIIFEEIADKTGKLHYQGIVYTDQPYNTYKAYANKHFDLWKGQQRRSFAHVKDLEKYMSYIYKGSNVSFKKGFSEEEHESNLEKSNRVNQEIIQKKEKRKAITFTQRIVTDYKIWRDEVEKDTRYGVAKYFKVEKKDNEQRFYVGRNHVCLWVLEYFRDNCKIFDPFIIGKFVNLIRLTYEDEPQEFLSACLEKCI